MSALLQNVLLDEVCTEWSFVDKRDSSESRANCDDVMRKLQSMDRHMIDDHNIMRAKIENLQIQIGDLTDENRKLIKRLTDAMNVIKESSLRTALCRLFTWQAILSIVLLTVVMFCPTKIILLVIVGDLMVSLIGYCVGGKMAS